MHHSGSNGGTQAAARRGRGGQARAFSKTVLVLSLLAISAAALYLVTTSDCI